jgi:hypothetical protein
MIGVVSLVFLSIIVVIMKSVNRKYILIRTGIFGVVGALLFFTSELSIIKLQYRNHPAYIEAYVNYKEHPNDDRLLDKLDLEYQRVWISEEDYQQKQNK